MSYKLGYFYSILSVVLMALAGPLQKMAIADSNPTVVTFYSCIAAFILSIVVGIYSCQWKLKFRTQTVLISIAYSLGIFCFCLALKFENPVIVTMISRINIIFNFFFAFVIFKDQISREKLYGLSLILMGVIGISFLSFDIKSLMSIGAVLSVGYAFLFSIHNSLLKHYDDSDVIDLLIWQNGISSVLMALLEFSSQGTLLTSSSSFTLAVLSGFLSSFLGFIFYQKGLKILSFSDVSSIRALSSTISLVVIYPFFPMNFSPIQTLGIFFVTIGCFIFNFKRGVVHERA